MTTWILVADSRKACILSPGPGKRFQMIRELESPEARPPGAEPEAARPRSRVSGSPLDRAAPLQDTGAVRFARQLARELKQACSSGEFDELTLVAPPHFLGLLRENLDHVVGRRVTASACKDLMGIRPHDLPRHLAGLVRPGMAE